MRRVGVADAIDGHAYAGNAGGNAVGKALAGIKEARVAGGCAGEKNIHIGSAVRYVGRAASRGRRGWRRQQTNDLHGVRIGVVTELLNGPHRHIVGRVKTGVREIAPPATAAAAWVAGGIVGRGTSGVENRSTHGPKRIIGQPANGAGIGIFIHSGNTEPHRRMTLAGNHHRSHPIVALIGSIAW